MIATTEKLALLIGGEIEVRNPRKNTLFTGRIGLIQVGAGKLTITPLWLARGKPTIGDFEKPIRWKRVSKVPYIINLGSANIEQFQGIGVEIKQFDTSLVIRLFPKHQIGLDPKITPIGDLRSEG